MPTLNSMVPMVRMHCRGCPIPAIEDAILHIAREFCSETKWLRESVAYDIVSGESIIELEAVTEMTEVIGVVAVQLSEDGRPLNPTTFEDVPQQDGIADFWIFEPPAEIWLTPTPTTSVEDGCLVRQILIPTADATSLSDSFVRRYGRKIADGAIGWLCSMPDAAWFNPTISDSFTAKFEDAKARAQAESDNQFKPRMIRTTPWR